MATAAASGRLTRIRQGPRPTPGAIRPRLRAWAQVQPAWALSAAIALLAALLRLIPWLASYPLHHDEALYGVWARLIASGQDPFLLTPWVDKPPLSIYLGAVSFKLFDVSELALRLPGMVASLLTVGATYRLARRVSEPGQRATPWLAAALLALSPFAVLFAPTAFTDPWLTLWLVVAAWTALAERPLAAGLAAGLAVASKQQGVLVIPLVLALLTGRGGGARPALRRVALAALGFALVFGPLTWWDSLRWHNRPSFWDRSLATYGGLGLAPLAAWPGRAVAWAEPLGYLFGTPVLSALVLGLALWGGRQRTRAGTLLGLYVAGYLLLHITVTFHPWDRYLLPILPLVCVLAAHGAAVAVRWLHDRTPGDSLRGFSRSPDAGGKLSRRLPGFVAAVALAAGIAHATWLGAAGRIPVGSDYGAYRGIDRVAAALADLPDDAVIYYRSLGWHLDFYLFAGPQERRWYDGAQKLADDAGRTEHAEPGRPQWLALPAWETPAAEELRAPLAARGLRLVAGPRFARPDGSVAFTLYRLAPLMGGGS